MPEKECSKCKVVKPLDGFHRQPGGKYGRRSYCNECVKQYSKDNREKISKQQAQWYQGNKEEIREQVKKYYQDNKEKKKEYEQAHRAERNEWQRNRYNNEPVVALRASVRSLIWHALKRNDGSKVGESVLQYLPYTIEELKEHLESLFEPGMTWENRTEWHIDHIYPHSKLPYDSMRHPNFLKAWALDNLQPLWAEDNLRKGNKVL